MTFAITSTRRMDLDTFASRTGLHPDLIRRLVTLGLLEAATEHGGELSFALSEVATARRLQRLRAGLCLNYAALGVVMDLLDRITALETALRHLPPSIGEKSWTPTD